MASATETNSMLGADVQWNVSRSLTLQAQFALDDLTYKDRGSSTRNPDRWAFTLMGFGPLGGRHAWRAFYTQASSLAFRTFDEQFQDFTDDGIGIGRNFADNDQLSLAITLPVGPHWLVNAGADRAAAGRRPDPGPLPCLGHTGARLDSAAFHWRRGADLACGLGVHGSIRPFRTRRRRGDSTGSRTRTMWRATRCIASKAGSS